jgi:gliding motility-associated-like protein
VQNYNDFVQPAPVSISDTLINGKTIYKYILDTNIIYNTVGTFNFQVIANNPTSDGCSGEQEINFDLIVIAPPDGNFNFVTNNCITDSVTLLDNTPVGDKPVYKYFWDLGDAKFFDTVLNLKFKPNREGEYKIRYVVANTIGCLSDTISKLFKIDSAINVNFAISKITCQNKDIEFFDLSKARGVSQMQNWYWDYGDSSKVDTLTTSTKQKHQYTKLQTYNAKLTIQTLNGCINSYTLPVVNNPNPKINVQLPEVCLADASAKFIDLTTIADNSTNKFSYLWNFNDSAIKQFPNPTLLISNALTAKNPEVKYLSPGKYVVSLRVVQDDTKCVDSARFSFTVNGSFPKPLFYILKDTALCSNEFVEIRDSSWVDIGAIGKLNIYWGDGSDTTVEEPTINKIYKHFYKNINAPSNLNLNYTIKINASSGGICQTAISNSLSIVPPPEFPIITTIKDYLCKSDTLVLNVLSKGGAAPFINTWTSDNTNAAIDNARSIIYGVTPGQVQASLKVKDNKNCIYPYPSLTFFNAMVVRDIPIAEILPGDSIICNGDAINIAGAGRGYDNSPISTYSWYRNDTLISTSSTNSINNNIPGWYKLKVNDGKCFSVATAGKKVSPFNITQRTFTHVPNICVGVPLIINTTAVEQLNVQYNWDFGDGFNYLKASPGNHKYIDKGEYKIKLKVTNDYCPRYNYQLIGNTVKVMSPVASKSFKYVFLANQDNIIITKKDPGYVVYKWSPALNISNAFIPDPIFNGDKYTEYSLTRTDTVSSCAVIDEYEIVVTREVFVKVPNAFTPNNDGLNDVLKVEHSIGVLPDGFDFKIFNRWGKLMFQTKDINIGWDGRDFNGVLQEMDGYNYVLYYKYDQITKISNGQFETNTIIVPPITGSVILFR